MTDCQRLIEACRVVEHSHRGMGHPQEGNPFYPWWEDCRWKCPLCLELMLAKGEDIDFDFTLAFRYKIRRVNLHLPKGSMGYDYEAEFWKECYREVVKRLPLPTGEFLSSPREYVREALASALRAGLEEAVAATIAEVV